ncbi:uncharacterized protein MELLADRAFT_102630 [Melampsora larici-populina 98AG31]|uniref:Uncharacterized protein n=1 Tax=Melampsora larici-populina (strain 98AG31 / pathotype 3-4-7) TaxID=747676 RepID=F4R8W1_MELLP|nr:uncharacterized protein MELLADRAFT_102630 [Melampsora larici-populina 98AG31]EGG10879.1 hypothetical protein MELLADRAFT_102630 [Melampsora larici-populina 98AG31]
MTSVSWNPHNKSCRYGSLTVSPAAVLSHIYAQLSVVTELQNMKVQVLKWCTAVPVQLGIYNLLAILQSVEHAMPRRLKPCHLMRPNYPYCCMNGVEALDVGSSSVHRGERAWTTPGGFSGRQIIYGINVTAQLVISTAPVKFTVDNGVRTFSNIINLSDNSCSESFDTYISSGVGKDHMPYEKISYLGTCTKMLSAMLLGITLEEYLQDEPEYGNNVGKEHITTTSESSSSYEDDDEFEGVQDTL